MAAGRSSNSYWVAAGNGYLWEVGWWEGLHGWLVAGQLAAWQLQLAAGKQDMHG